MKTSFERWVKVGAMSTTECRATVTLPAELPEFVGHFEEKAVLPGVVQLAWVRFLASHWAGTALVLQSIGQMKFTHPLTIGDEVSIALQKDEGDWVPGLKQTLRFTYTIHRETGDIVASQGRISLCA